MGEDEAAIVSNGLSQFNGQQCREVPSANEQCLNFKQIIAFFHNCRCIRVTLAENCHSYVAAAQCIATGQNATLNSL